MMKGSKSHRNVFNFNMELVQSDQANNDVTNYSLPPQLFNLKQDSAYQKFDEQKEDEVLPKFAT